MSDAKVLCPKGSKLCPACKNFVKGPRTRVCGCGHEFFKAAADKPAKVTAKPKAVAVAVTAEPTIVRIPDPYTFSEIVNRGRGQVITRRAAGIVVQPNNAAKVMKYVSQMGAVPIVPFDNIVTIA